MRIFSKHFGISLEFNQKGLVHVLHSFDGFHVKVIRSWWEKQTPYQCATLSYVSMLIWSKVVLRCILFYQTVEQLWEKMFKSLLSIVFHD